MNTGLHRTRKRGGRTRQDPGHRKVVVTGRLSAAMRNLGCSLKTVGTLKAPWSLAVMEASWRR